MWTTELRRALCKCVQNQKNKELGIPIVNSTTGQSNFAHVGTMKTKHTRKHKARPGTDNKPNGNGKGVIQATLMT